jgi:Na+/proline symporter
VSPLYVLGLIVAYFSILFAISLATARKTASSQSFFVADRQSPWYIVAFGMIGTSISGVTFISVPGAVGADSWAYFQVVLGYLLGYWVIIGVLLPLYYRTQLTSIYEYLRRRLGPTSHKTGAAFFILSRTIGAAFRMFLVASVLHTFVLARFGMPFAVTVVASIALIWLYTFRGGMKTIIWTDNLQTTFMIASLIITMVIIAGELGLNASEVGQTVSDSPLSKIFFWEWRDGNFFWKKFLSGAFITIAMTGLDQDMMQKNLACRSLGDAQKNMFWFSLTLVLVNLAFLTLGTLLYAYVDATGITPPVKSDLLFPTLALDQFGLFAGTVFTIGIIAANYASADSALTALTTSFCVDFLGFGKPGQADRKALRTYVHLGFSVMLGLLILVFAALNDEAVINQLFKIAGYTYGPLLGLFAFGMFTKRATIERLVPIVCVLAPVICYVLNRNSVEWFNGYVFDFELLILNGLLTFFGLLAISRPAEIKPLVELLKAE